jgi:hypothetical protein
MCTVIELVLYEMLTFSSVSETVSLETALTTEETASLTDDKVSLIEEESHLM